MIERLKQRATFRQCSHSIQTNSIEPLENVAGFPMLRDAAMLFKKSLDFLESGDNALLTRRASARLLWRCKLGKLCNQFVKIEVIHSALPS